jgi:hypothetical protein
VKHERLAMFLMAGQVADRVVRALPDLPPADQIMIGPQLDLVPLMPEIAHRALQAGEVYKLFFMFENHLREFVVDELSKDGAMWFDAVPPDVQKEVADLEATEEMKRWMALGSRDKSALLTYPQLVKIMDHNWKKVFEDVVRDRGLLNALRNIAHLRNTICHMTEIPEEEAERVRQTMRDWFRVVAP